MLGAIALAWLCSAANLLPQGLPSLENRPDIGWIAVAADARVASPRLGIEALVAGIGAQLASVPLPDTPSLGGDLKLLEDGQSVEWLPRTPPSRQVLAGEQHGQHPVSDAFASADPLPYERPPSLSA